MGSRIVALAREDQTLRVVAAIEAAGNHFLGSDAGERAGGGRLGVNICERSDAAFDVIIDFSSPEGTVRALDACLEAGKPIVIGTTGHDTAQRARIVEASRRIAIVHAPNMSVGVNVMLRLVRDLAKALGDEYDCEIIETHHRFKADAPSGTALALLDRVREARPHAQTAHGRSGVTGQRPSGQIGMHAVRLGDTVGEHIVAFGSLGETVSLKHEAHTRDTFAAGALRAARWIVNRPTGLYSMQDVLFGGSGG